MSALWLLNPNLSQADIIELTEQKAEAGERFLETVGEQLKTIDDPAARMEHFGFAMSLFIQFYMI